MIAMAELVIDQDMVEAAVVGGAVLGGGGGGSMDWGRELGQLAVRLGTVRLVNIDNINAEDTIVTVSAVGAPAAKQARPAGWLYPAVELLMEQAPIIADGLITNECGERRLLTVGCNQRCWGSR